MARTTSFARTESLWRWSASANSRPERGLEKTHADESDDRQGHDEAACGARHLLRRLDAGSHHEVLRRPTCRRVNAERRETLCAKVEAHLQSGSLHAVVSPWPGYARTPKTQRRMRACGEHIKGRGAPPPTEIARPVCRDGCRGTHALMIGRVRHPNLWTTPLLASLAHECSRGVRVCPLRCRLCLGEGYQ